MISFSTSFQKVSLLRELRVQDFLFYFSLVIQPFSCEGSVGNRVALGCNKNCHVVRVLNISSGSGGCKQCGVNENSK